MSKKPKTKALDDYDMPKLASFLFGPEVKYDLDAAPITTYCPECGHETGQEQPHAKDCPCFICDRYRRAPKWKDLKGKKITFRTFNSLETTP